MHLEQLMFQTLQKIELIDPWPGEVSGVAGASLIAGAMILHFDQAAVVCTSPLRCMRNQSGTSVAAPGIDSMVSLGYRLNLIMRDDVGLMFPLCLYQKGISPQEWMIPAAPAFEPNAQMLLFAELEGQGQTEWSYTMRFLSGSYYLKWRPDLDGCIEFSPAGKRHTIGGSV